MIKFGDVIFTVITDERIERSNSITQYPVEDGGSVVDNIESQNKVISISGMINGVGAFEKLKKLDDYMQNHDVLTYYGRNIVPNCAIETFGSNHGVTIKGGYLVEMTLVVIRITSPETFKPNTALISTMSVAKKQKAGKKQKKYVVTKQEPYVNVKNNTAQKLML